MSKIIRYGEAKVETDGLLFVAAGCVFYGLCAIYDPNSHVSHTFSYAYQFIVDGKSYKNNANDRSLTPGDSVEVEYVKGWPSLNRAVHPRD